MRVPLERPRLPAALALPRVSGIMLRRLPSEPRLLLLVAVVCVSTLILAATPRYLTQVSDDGIRQAVDSVPARQSSISVIIEHRIGVSRSGSSFEDLLQRGQDYHASLPATVRDVTTYQGYLAESPDFEIVDGFGNALYGSRLQYLYLSIRYQDDVWNHITLSEGRMPGPREPMRPGEALGVDVLLDNPVPVFEIVVSAETAASLNAGLGDRFLINPNFGSAIFPGNPSADPRFRHRSIAEISGIIAINDPDAPYWLGDTRLRQPGRSQSGEQIYIYAAALAAETEQVYADLYRGTLGTSSHPNNWRYTWSFPAQPDAFDSSSSDALAQELRRLESTRGPTELLIDAGVQAEIRSGLPALIDTYAAQQRAFATTLALAAAGLLALSLVLSALLATLIIERRRGTFALLRGRGASTMQLMVSQAIESAIIVVPAAAAGLLLSVLLVNAGTLDQPRVIAIAVGLAVVALLVATAYTRLIRPPLRTVDRPPPDLGRRSQQRTVIEIAVIIMALVGALLLRRRGIDSGVSEERSGLLGVDPYLALTPVLLGFAIGVLAVRALPGVAKLLARVLARRRGLVGYVALRRIGRSSDASTLPFIALLLAVAISVFSLIVSDSIDHGQRAAALRSTGADFRIESPSGIDLLPEQFDLAAVPGIDTVALAAITTGVSARTGAPVPDRIALLTIDPQAYARVIDGTALSATYADDLAALAAAHDDSVVPCLVSAGWAARRGLKAGDTFEATIGPARVMMVVQGIGAAPPGMPAGQLFAVVSHDGLRAFSTTFDTTRPTHAYLRAGDNAGVLLEELLAGAGDTAQLVSRVAIYEQSRSAPLTGGVATGFRLTVAIAAMFAALASIASLVISARQRGRDLGFLRTMGLTQRQALRLVITENVPMVLAATIVGGLLGIATAWVIEPGLDLSPFAGTHAVRTPLQVNLAGIIAISAAITAVVLLTTALFVLLTRRDQLGQLLRVGDE